MHCCTGHVRSPVLAPRRSWSKIIFLQSRYSRTIAVYPHSISTFQTRWVGRYHSVKYVTVPDKSFRYSGDLPPPLAEPPNMGCRHTTCYADIFYPFLTRWNSTSDVDVEYQRAKAYGVVMAATAALGFGVWASLWTSTGGSFR